jgi:chromosomal replication initiator protein
LDDIQFLIGKEQTQEGFFHTFNALHMDGRQIVVTSDRPIGELTVLQDRVRSRLAGGLVVDIQAPGLETRLAILRAKAEASAMAGRVSTEALELLADLAHRNVRELEGGLNRAIAYAELTGSVVTAETVRRVLSTAVARNRYTPVSQSGVLDAVTAHYSLDLRDLTSRRRDAHTTLARHVAMYLLREDAHMGLAEIGRAFGGRDHSTVLHARNRVSSLMREDDGLRHELADLRRAISAPLLATSP